MEIISLSGWEVNQRSKETQERLNSERKYQLSMIMSQCMKQPLYEPLNIPTYSISDVNTAIQSNLSTMVMFEDYFLTTNKVDNSVNFTRVNTRHKFNKDIRENVRLFAQFNHEKAAKMTLAFNQCIPRCELLCLFALYGLRIKQHFNLTVSEDQKEFTIELICQDITAIVNKMKQQVTNKEIETLTAFLEKHPTNIKVFINMFSI